MTGGLANATQHIGTNPTGDQVTAPTISEHKSADIDRKMHLYGVIQAFRNGQYPSNRQIDETLDYVMSNTPFDEKKLSKEGRHLIDDVRKIIGTAKEIVAEKNADELFQGFLYHTRHVDTGKANPSQAGNAIDKNQAQEHGQQAVEHLRTLGRLIFTNSEARKLLKDFGILARDVVADGAAKLSDVARPADHELNNVDEPAPSNQWVGPDGETRSHNDPVPASGLGAKADQAKQAKDQAAAKKDQVKDQAANQAQEHKDNIAGAADRAQQQQGGEYARDEDRAKAAADAGASQAAEEKEKAKGSIKSAIPGIPQEHKDRAKDLSREQLEKTKQYAREKFPEERRERFIYRLKKVLVENQNHRDYQEAVEFFLEKFEHYQGVAKNATQEGGSGALNVRNDDDWQRAENELRTLLERFANGQSMQPIFDAVNQLYVDAQNDPELRHFFTKLDSYIRQVLLEPGWVMKNEASEQGQQLQNESKRFFDPQNGKYAGHKDAVFDNISSFFTAYAEDDLNDQLGRDVKNLTTDLLYDSDGQLTFKKHLWDDLRQTIFPALAKSVGYVPIPRIEYADDSMEIVLENLTLELANMLPNVFEIEARNYFKLSPYDAIKDQSKHSFWISFSQIQADLKDINFFVNKKSGFPKIKTQGLADVRVSGKGISGRIHLSSTGKKGHAFVVEEVKIKLDKLNFSVRDTKYSWLVTAFKPIATGLIKKAVAKAIEMGIKSSLVQVDAQLADIRERLEDAVENHEGLSKIDAIKQSFQEKADSANAKKEKAKEKAPDGKLNIAATRDSRIIKGYDGVDGFTAKEGQMADLARPHENGWKSPAFDIVPTSSYKKGAVSYGNVSGSGQPVGAGASTGRSAGHSATGTSAGQSAGHSVGQSTGANTGYSTGAPAATHTTHTTGGAPPRTDVGSTAGFAEAPSAANTGYSQQQQTAPSTGYTQAEPNTTQTHYATGTTGHYNQGSSGYPQATQGQGQYTQGSTGQYDQAPAGNQYAEQGDASRDNTDQHAKPSWINSTEARRA